MGRRREFANVENSCELAHALVLEQCPICALCRENWTGCRKSLTSLQEALPFECDLGADDWNSTWSSSKKSWCCVHEGRGCVFEAEPPKHDCHKGHEPHWTAEKSVWCCKAEKVGCPHQDPFDCETHMQEWQTWSKARKNWCHKHSAFAILYECDAMDASWDARWTDEKKTWCCSYSPRWSSSRREWCCRGEGVDCTQVFEDVTAKFELIRKLSRITPDVSLSLLVSCSFCISLLFAGCYRVHAIRLSRANPRQVHYGRRESYAALSRQPL